jgi:hypothetical protein
MNVPHTQPSSLKNIPSEGELLAIKKILASFLLACKNLSLYPSGHTISKNSIYQLYLQLCDFLQKYGTLRLEIERERILSKDELISEGLPEEGTLHFALFQVGIRWLEFIEGIELDELLDILIILDKYSRLAAEPEGDIVTAFWEAQFPHIRYEVVDFSWADEQEAENGLFGITGEQAFGMQFGDYRWKESEIPEDPAIDYAHLSLTPQEKTRLKEMIRLEEESDLTYYLNALMDSLLQHREKENFNIILETLSEEFTGSLIRRDFTAGLTILQGLRTVLDICKTETPWTILSIDDFFLKASGLESLAPLQEVWKHLDSEEAGILGQIFKLLNPQAIHLLGSLLLQTQPAPLREILLDSAIFLSSQDMRPLESMLNNSDEILVEKLVPVIVNIPGRSSIKYLMRLTRHPSPRVRQEAVKGIFSRDSTRLKDLFNMIDDKDESIRQLVFRRLGRARDDTVEDLLLAYLGDKKFNKKEEEHLLLCFQTLGKCGSARSLSFLRETLFKGRWIPGFRKSGPRRGAVMALLALETPEAENVLKEASRSFYPSLRAIIRKIRKETGTEGAKKSDE